MKFAYPLFLLVLNTANKEFLFSAGKEWLHANRSTLLKNFLTFVLILHFEASQDWSAAEPAVYDKKNDGANKKLVYADRAALTVLRESYNKIATLNTEISQVT